MKVGFNKWGINLTEWNIGKVVLTLNNTNMVDDTDSSVIFRSTLK